MKIYLNSIKFNRSLVDGPGVRTVVFFQGCDLHCKGCQNPSAWDIRKGTAVGVEELANLLKKEVCNKKITFSGGEPLMQAEGLIALVELLADFDIAVYTGHELCDVPKRLLDRIRYIKTGAFKEELHTTVTPFVGSSNQEFRRLH
ncbi:MAG: radical SAM protein [Clostridia bacterium]|nr:radical SAM protein [Clostridia bacterium]